jgi:hypothetical protein
MELEQNHINNEHVGTSTSNINIVGPSHNNINYYADASNYIPSQETHLRMKTMLCHMEFTPDRWNSWLQAIKNELLLTFNLDRLIQEDVNRREVTPVRYTNEDDASFFSRIDAFTKRKLIVFRALTNHICRDPDRHMRSQELCRAEESTSDPYILLDKLRDTVKGTKVIEMAQLVINLGNLLQGSDSDYRYLDRFNKLCADMDAAKLEISHEAKVSKFIHGMGDQHMETQKQLYSMTPESLSTTTIQYVFDLMRASTASSTQRQLSNNQGTYSANYTEAYHNIPTWDTPPENGYEAMQRVRQLPESVRKFQPGESDFAQEERINRLIGAIPPRRIPYKAPDTDYAKKLKTKSKNFTYTRDKPGAKLKSSTPSTSNKVEDKRPSYSVPDKKKEENKAARCTYCRRRGHLNVDCRIFKDALAQSQALSQANANSVNGDPSGITSST